MKPGDLVLFDHTMWEWVVRGRTALVLDVRKDSLGMWEDDVEFDVLMDGAVIKDLPRRRWDGSPHEGIEVINEAG
jgi:hypothetical protein